MFCFRFAYCRTSNTQFQTQTQNQGSYSALAANTAFVTLPFRVFQVSIGKGCFLACKTLQQCQLLISRNAPARKDQVCLQVQLYSYFPFEWQPNIRCTGGRGAPVIFTFEGWKPQGTYGEFRAALLRFLRGIVNDPPVCYPEITFSHITPYELVACAFSGSACSSGNTISHASASRSLAEIASGS